MSCCTFTFSHCVVCPSLIYGFWLPLRYLQTFVWKDTGNNLSQNVKLGGTSWKVYIRYVFVASEFIPVLSVVHDTETLFFCVSFLSTIVCLFVPFLLVIIVSIFLRVTTSDYNLWYFWLFVTQLFNQILLQPLWNVGQLLTIKFRQYEWKKVHTCIYFYWLDIRTNTHIYLNIFVDFLWVSITFLLVYRSGGHDVQIYQFTLILMYIFYCVDSI